uniref:Uncharacterized protein n=1 Tax=Panagrolaimus superbus TaxID=310955 RepID=A0A914Z477_9BILA
MIYSSILSKLIERKSISTFSVDISSDYILGLELLTIFAKTVKELKIPHNFFNAIELPMDLDSLIIMDNQMTDVMDFSFDKFTLTITSNFWLWKQILIEKFIRVNSNVSNFTHLIFKSKTNHSTVFADVNPVFLIKCFPSLEELQFDLELTPFVNLDNRFTSDEFEEILIKLAQTFQIMPSVPSKMIYNISGKDIPEFWFLDRYYNRIFQPFSKVKHFSKKFLFNNSRNTVFEIRITY